MNYDLTYACVAAPTMCWESICRNISVCWSGPLSFPCTFSCGNGVLH